MECTDKRKCAARIVVDLREPITMASQPYNLLASGSSASSSAVSGIYYAVDVMRPSQVWERRRIRK